LSILYLCFSLHHLSGGFFGEFLNLLRHASLNIGESAENLCPLYFISIKSPEWGMSLAWRDGSINSSGRQVGDLLLMPYAERILEIRSQIRPLVVEVIEPGCSSRCKEQLIKELIPLYLALFSLQEELELN